MRDTKKVLEITDTASFMRAAHVLTPHAPRRLRPRFSVTDQPQYRSPPGFVPWRDHLEACDFRQFLPAMLTYEDVSGSPPFSYIRVGEVAFSVMQNKAPAFFLSRELVQAFNKTQRPAIPDDLKMILPAFHLMLPVGAMPTETPGHSLSAILVEWVDESSLFIGEDRNEYKARGSVVLRMVGISTEHIKQTWIGTVSYFNIAGSREDLNPLPVAPGAKEEVVAVDQRMAALVCSALLTMYYEPQLVTTDPSGTGLPVHLQSRAERKRTMLPTTWIGKSYKPRTSSSDCKGGTHASPATHWRRGHWHHVRHGQGRELKRLCWYEPILVNKEMSP